jgi:RNA polymerase sigma factor (sigma-70 family)
MTAASARQIVRVVGALAGALALASLSDREMLRRFAAARDEAAFAALVRRHGPMVLQSARRVLGNGPDAEDVFQAAFVLLARKAGAGRWRDSVGGWLHVVAHRLALAARREARLRRQRDGCATPRPTPDALDEVTGRELCAALDEELGRLPEAYRDILVLCCLEGLTRDEAARRLGCSVGAVRGRLERGRELLRRRLSRRGITLSAGLAGLALTPSAGGAAVPALLVAATLRAAHGPGLAGASARAAALAGGLLRTLAVRKLRAVAAAVVAACGVTVALGAGLAGRQAPAPPPEAPAEGMPADRAEGRPALGKDAYGDPLPPGVVSRLGTVRLRQGANITSVAFLPDGKAAATASLDNTLRLWDLATGRELARFGEPNGTTFHGQLFCLDVAPDGKRLVVGGNAVRLRVYDRPTGKEVWTAQAGVVDAVAFSPDGGKVATAHRDKGAAVWDARTGKEICQLRGHTEAVLGVAFTPDGKAVATAGGDKTVRLWDPATGRELRRLEAEKPAAGPAFSPDGRLLASGGGGAAVLLWDVATGKEVRRLSFPEAWVRSVAFSPDGRTLAAASADYDLHATRGRVLLFDVASGRRLRQLTEGDYQATEAVRFSPNGRTLAAVGGHDSTLHLYDVATGRDVSPVGGHQGPVMQGLFLAGGRQAVTSGNDATVRCWDVATGRELRRRAGAFVAAAGGTTLVSFAGVRGRELAFWDRVSGQELRRRKMSGDNSFLASDPAGTTLAVAGADHAIRLFDIVTGEERGLLEGHRGRIQGLAFSADGSRLASAGQEDHSVRVWDVARVRELSNFAASAFSVALSPDGSLVAAGGDDEGVRVWDVATLREVLWLKNDETFWTRACNVLFSPDGRTLATGSMNGQVRLWEVATGQERRRLEGHPDWVACLAFTPNGRRLLTGGLDTSALVWDLAALPGIAEPRTDMALRALWEDLASPDAGRAYRAVLSTAAFPGRVVPLLKDRLPPAPRDLPQAKRLARLIADLDADAFDVREKAGRELDRLGEAAVPALRRALAGSPSAELRRRAEGLLEKWDPQTPTGETLRQLRAVEALELADTAEARRLLKEWADGGETRRTHEARAALRRLGRGSP